MPGLRRGFTLIELLVVIGVIAISFGMIAYLPTADRRDAAVQSAAQELAATIRLARSFAIDRRCCVGLVFNIENGAGTTGRQINNWGGQHWYRIIGPSFNGYNTTDDNKNTDFFPGYPLPNFYNGNLGEYRQRIESSWIGDQHHLKAKAVRILAVSDQDNGLVWRGSDWSYTATYPRPWFGWWDSTSKRLYPWGGYDHVLLGKDGKHSSGFYYEGTDGAIDGCKNPADRLTIEGTTVFSAGAVRPLINGNNLDYLLRFNPDGSVDQPAMMEARRNSTANSDKAKIGDLFPSSQIDEDGCWPMTSWVRFTGGWSITLAPDLDTDNDVYPSSDAALRSMMPMYRVQVSPLGSVRVIKVQNSPPRGTNVTIDTQITNWQTQSQTSGNWYKYQLPTDKKGNLRKPGSLVSELSPAVVPASDFVFPTMLSSQRWWMQVPP